MGEKLDQEEFRADIKEEKTWRHTFEGKGEN